MRTEQERLAQNPNFELPYGQAWLLLLLREIEIHNESSQAMHSLKSEIVQRIGNWLEENEFPEKNPNSYHSWLITYFLFKKSKSDLEYQKSHFLDDRFNSVVSVNDANDPKYFFSSESLFQILKNQGKMPFDPTPEIEKLRPITSANGHGLGKLISR